MRKNFLAVAGLLWMMFLAFTACSETTEESTYFNWEERNRTYLDSIANVARTNSSGEWKVIKSYTLPADNLNGTVMTPDNTNYIYVRVLGEGTGETTVKYQDTVRVHYRGKLMNGTVFEQSFKAYELNEEALKVAIPSKFSASAVINGWTTALQQMKEGDHWEVFIPWTLAYGPTNSSSTSSTSSTIEAYSVLRFEMYLARIYPYEEYYGTTVPDWN